MSRQYVASDFPTAEAPDALAVTDGREFIGTVIEHDGAHFAFDADGERIGKFPIRADAKGRRHDEVSSALFFSEGRPRPGRET